MIARKAAWAAALEEFLRERARSPFIWGVRDCSLFAADAIYAMTGTDIAAKFRGHYHSEATAFACITQVTGGKTVGDAAAWCAREYGLPEWKHPLQAQRGDLVVLPNAGRLIAAIVHLNGIHAVTVTEQGLAPFPLTAITQAWSVPVADRKAGQHE